PVFAIDTPPPYPSGDFHMGNVLNWTYFDVVARYKRMRGYNVLFPQGWDCHGLPTEVRVEQKHGITKTQVPPEEFRRLCIEFVEENIRAMRKAIRRLGYSIDWSLEYKTMDPDYWRRTQLSFVILYKRGLIYRGKHPVNWCPRCGTAIADAEVEYETRKDKLYYIRFGLADEPGRYLTIATTRPELIPACVAAAVHPEDGRYTAYVGRELVVPIVGRRVRIFADEMVDPDFGTGVVMICTYGDKEDVRFVAKHDLPVVACIGEDGRMTEGAGRYAGLTVEEAREAIVKDLRASGLLEKEEDLIHEVGTCWRCHTPIEILVREQWFMRTRQLTGEVVKKALEEVRWYPDHMKWRLVDWASSLDWDWVISRQRVFATPIPVWYCARCGHIIVAEPEWLPVDPRREPPKLDKCPRCGCRDFRPETDVLDTWFDSSITCAVHAGWPDKPDWRRRFPADLHPSGYDIIRTWAYYLMVRHIALFGEAPFRACLINGMVLGTDGRMMHKSYGNYVPAEEPLDRYGADATRWWAIAGGTTGSDIPFRWEEVRHGWRFLRKLWNASRFASAHLSDYEPSGPRPELKLIDRWLLSKLARAVEEATEAMEEYRFNVALEAVRDFTWRILCDQYIEAVKHRLYGPGGPDREAARFTLYTALYCVIRLLAPICPHITEEIYQRLFRPHEGHKSIHISPWPRPPHGFPDEEAEEAGDLVIDLIRAVRREKARRRIPLNARLAKVVVYAGSEERAELLRACEEDIKGTCKIDVLEILPSPGEGVEVEGHPGLRFSM
ncbi:valine--tRNA ligase, partial [Candidatus Bathyarchaeota archaeon]